MHFPKCDLLEWDCNTKTDRQRERESDRETVSDRKRESVFDKQQEGN